jgi:hypothetical protein
MANLYKHSEAAGWSTGNRAPLEIDTDDGRIYINRTGTREAIDTDAVEILAAADTLTAEESGKTVFLDLVGGFTVTLPAVAVGLKFSFIVKTAPTTAYIIAGAAGDLLIGQAHSSTGGDADSETTAGADQLNFVASTALAGDRADFVSDGTYWYVQAFSDADGGITFTG